MAKQAMNDAMNDPEAVKLKEDKEVGPIIEQIQKGDISGVGKLTKRPEVMEIVKRLMKKYMKKKPETNN